MGHYSVDSVIPWPSRDGRRNRLSVSGLAAPSAAKGNRSQGGQWRGGAAKTCASNSGGFLRCNGELVLPQRLCLAGNVWATNPRLARVEWRAQSARRHAALFASHLCEPHGANLSTPRRIDSFICLSSPGLCCASIMVACAVGTSSEGRGASSDACDAERAQPLMARMVDYC